MGPKEFKDMMDYLTRPRMADGGRTSFYEAGLVKRGPRKGEYFVDTDPREYFKTEKLANKYIKDIKEGKFRKTAAGDKFLTGAEFKKLYRKFKSGTDAEFAKLLNDRGFLTSTGAPFNAESVESRRSRLGIKSKSPNQNISNRSILKQAREMKLDIKGKSIDQIRRSVLESRSLEKGKTAEELKKLRDFRERKVLMAGKERQFPFNIGKNATPKDLFWKDLLDNAQRHQASILNRPGPLLPESHIKFKDPNQVRPTDTKGAFKIKLVDSNVLDKKGNPKVLTYDNFLKHIDDNQKLYRTDSKTALQEYKKKRFIQENPDLRDQFNKKLNKAYDPTSRTSRAVFSPMHIHHTAGRGRNAFNVQFAVGTENMQENALRRAFNKNFAKAKNFGEQRTAVTKYLNSVPPNLEVRLKNTPYGQRETLIDMTKRVAPELEQQVRAAGGAKLFSRIPVIQEIMDVARSIPGDVAKKSYFKAAGKAAGLAFTPVMLYDTYKALEQGKPLIESLEQGLIGTNLIGGTKDILSLNPEERMARSVVKQDALKDLNLDMPMGFGFIEGPTPQTNMTLPEAQQKMDAGIQRVQQERAQRESDIAANRANLLGNLKSRIFDIGGIGQDYQLELAGGGIAKEAGDPSGAMLESMNPDSQGLPGLLKRVRNR